MFKKVSDNLLLFYKKLIYSIAFIPTIMVLLSFVLAIWLFHFERTGAANSLKDSLKFILVLDVENARLILTTIIGGIISLTVFSFSMVMVVLNRTSASLSPRVLPQLVAQKFHQVVLGFYMGTIVYSLIMANNISTNENLPSLGILLSMLLAIFSLGLFIYFIHSISQSIQVDNILSDILKRTRRQIEAIQKKNEKLSRSKHENTGRWRDVYKATQTGYYHVVVSQALQNKLSKKNLQLEICVYPGKFVIEGTVMAKLNKEDDDSGIIEDIQSCFRETENADDEEQFYFGLRKISEIAVKALSPGINDPGTALKAIRYLAVLFAELVNIDSHTYVTDKKGNLRIIKALPQIDTLFFECIAPIRQFAASSLEIHVALFEFFETLLIATKVKPVETLKKHLVAQLFTSDLRIKNARDRETINECIDKIKKAGFQNQEIQTISSLAT